LETLIVNPGTQREPHLAYVRVVQRCIHLVQDEEGSRTEAEGENTNRVKVYGLGDPEFVGHMLEPRPLKTNISIRKEEMQFIS